MPPSFWHLMSLAVVSLFKYVRVVFRLNLRRIASVFALNSSPVDFRKSTSLIIVEVSDIFVISVIFRGFFVIDAFSCSLFLKL